MFSIAAISPPLRGYPGREHPSLKRSGARVGFLSQAPATPPAEAPILVREKTLPSSKEAVAFSDMAFEAIFSLVRQSPGDFGLDVRSAAGSNSPGSQFVPTAVVLKTNKYQRLPEEQTDGISECCLFLRVEEPSKRIQTYRAWGVRWQWGVLPIPTCLVKIREITRQKPEDSGYRIHLVTSLPKTLPQVAALLALFDQPWTTLSQKSPMDSILSRLPKPTDEDKKD